MCRFDHRSTTDDILRNVSLSGKVALVTGATSGIGLATAKAAAAGAGSDMAELHLPNCVPDPAKRKSIAGPCKVHWKDGIRGSLQVRLSGI